MNVGNAINVREAAELLGVEDRAVRLLAAAGDLEAVKRGNAWWIDRADAERRRRQRRGRGRPLSPAMAWSVLLLASGHEPRPEVLGEQHHPARARRWLATHSLADSAARLRARATRESFDAHPSELERVVQRGDVMRTGISAAEVVGIHGGAGDLEIYAPAGHRRAIVDEHALEPGHGPVLLRWIPGELWSAVHGDLAPHVAILVDLLEHEAPRARREAERALRHAYS